MLIIIGIETINGHLFSLKRCEYLSSLCCCCFLRSEIILWFMAFHLLYLCFGDLSFVLQIKYRLNKEQQKDY